MFWDIWSCWFSSFPEHSFYPCLALVLQVYPCPTCSALILPLFCQCSLLCPCSISFPSVLPEFYPKVPLFCLCSFRSVPGRLPDYLWPSCSTHVLSLAYCYSATVLPLFNSRSTSGLPHFPVLSLAYPCSASGLFQVYLRYTSFYPCSGSGLQMFFSCSGSARLLFCLWSTPGLPPGLPHSTPVLPLAYYCSAFVLLQVYLCSTLVLHVVVCCCNTVPLQVTWLMYTLRLSFVHIHSSKVYKQVTPGETPHFILYCKRVRFASTPCFNDWKINTIKHDFYTKGF